MKKQFLFLLALATVQTVFGQQQEVLSKAVHYRNIGPFRGGRSVAASGVVQDPLTYYMGTTGGGLWKTEDAGQHWNNVSDGFFNTGSVGAVAVSESHPNIVYVGMGEHAPRGVMTTYGDGVYKSLDGGKTWQHLGLEATQHISRIRIHPSNPDIVYVSAQGALHGPNHRIGLYDMVMLKDNHIDYCGGVTKAIETTLAYLAREKRDIPVIVETRTLAEVRECLEFPMLYRILLDNMSVSLMRETVALVNRKIPTEASGNITRETIVAVAETGVDYISMGAITYSAGVLDISLKAVS